MHQVIVDSLEEYLAGTLAPADRRQIEAHLDTCDTCRVEVTAMAELSELFVPLRPADPVLPSAGFTARVMERVGAQSKVLSLWGWFSPDNGFGRRVVFASLVMLALLGSYLVSRETQYSAGPPTPESVMLADQNNDSNVPSNRDRMLVTLSSYEP